MFGGRQLSGFVPGRAGRQHVHRIECELRDRGLDQCHVRDVRRIERTAEDADARWARRRAQSQSRRTRKSRVKAASGESGGSARR